MSNTWTTSNTECAVHTVYFQAHLSDADQWELLQEAASQHKWHVVSFAIQTCSIGSHPVVHHKLFAEALLQGEWGVVRALVKRQVRDVPLCYQESALQLLQLGKWSIAGQVFQGCTEKDEHTFSEVLTKAVARQEWSTVLQLAQSGLTTEQRLFLFETATNHTNWPVIKQLTTKRDSIGIYLSQYAFGIAALRSNWDLVCHYVHQGVDINEQDREGNTALHLAALQRDQEGVHKLMRLSPDVNILNNDQVSPFHITVRNKAWDVAKLMIESGGNICLPDKHNDTVLKYLLEVAQADVLHFAVSRGCNIMAESVKDRTALHVLLFAGYYDTVREVVDQGTDPDIVADGRTMLHFAANRTALSSMESCVSLCIELGLSTHQPSVTDGQIRKCSSTQLANGLRNSPICMALRNKSVPFKVLWMLLESGASSNFELNLLKSWKQLKNIESTGANGKQKVLYLTNTASNAQSLRHLCRLTISHQMGCKGDRRQRIASLPLPRQMKDYVSFSDVLSVVKYQGKRML